MAATARQALITRPIDFWLLGGGSLVVLALMMVIRALYPNATLSSENWLALAMYLRIAIEYPHLFATYKLAYSRGPEFARRHSFAMILGPILLLSLAMFCIIGLETKWFPHVLTNWATWLLYGGIHALFLGFGWHRLRQVWGCMALYARYDNVVLNSRQRWSVHSFLLSMWIFGYITFITTSRQLNFFGLYITGYDLPLLWIQLAAAAFILSGIFFFIEIVFLPARQTGRLPSLNFMIPLVAILFWWAAMSLEPLFFIFLAPTFHSIQYLAVVWAYEKGRPRFSPFLILVTLGFIWEYLPNQTFSNGSVVIAIAYIVLSLHHYLLDGVIWRTSDPNLRNLLD